MTELYLIRHIQAEGNLYRMMQGWWDGGVTEAGLKQRDALAERFRGEKLDAVYSSDLYRAMVTASGVTKHHPDIKINKSCALRELNVGRLERKFFGDILHDEPENMKLFMYDSEKWTCEGAETFLEAGARGLEELKRIARAHNGQRVAVVSHGVTIRSMLSLITGVPLCDTERLPICFNASITKLVFSDGAFSVESFNDTSHLGTMPLWNAAVPSLRAESFNPMSDPSWYRACYGDAWTVAHGSLAGFNSEAYLLSAASHYSADKNSVLKIFDGDNPAGMVEMDVLKGSETGKGWISFLYLTEAYRGRGLGIQLLARAYMHYADLGRDTIGLNVAQSNAAAAAFYRNRGFYELSRSRGAVGTLITMEKQLKARNAAL